MNKYTSKITKTWNLLAILVVISIITYLKIISAVLIYEMSIKLHTFLSFIYCKND